MIFNKITLKAMLLLNLLLLSHTSFGQDDGGTVSSPVGTGGNEPTITVVMKYQFLDAIINRRLDVSMPEFDRVEFLGTGEVYINGTSNSLLGQYDLTMSDDLLSSEKFADCITMAKESLSTGQYFIIEGKANAIGLGKGGYKTLIFLEGLEGCSLL